MSQQINLFNPSLIRKRDDLSFNNLCYAFLACICACFVWAYWQHNQTAWLNLQVQQSSQQLKTIQAQLKKVHLAHTPQTPDMHLVQVLAGLKNKQAEQAMMMDVVGHKLETNDQSISEYMRGFASQAVDGLWLTGFKVNATEHSVMITGRSLDTTLLPKYIESLRKAEVFSGQSFGGLKISGNPASNTSNVESPAKSDEHKLAPTNPYIEFELEAFDARTAVLADPITPSIGGDHPSGSQVRG